MEKHIYNEPTGISYTLQGDYYLPDLALSDEEEQSIGLWGQRHQSAWVGRMNNICQRAAELVNTDLIYR